MAVIAASWHPRVRLLVLLLFPGATRSVRITLSSDFPWISKSTSFVRQRRTEHLLETPGLVLQSGKTDGGLLSRKCRQKTNAW